MSSDSDKEVLALRKKLREVEMERDILKSGAYLWQKRVVGCQLIDTEKPNFPRGLLCRVRRVSESA